jgi:hypothetical protein
MLVLAGRILAMIRAGGLQGAVIIVLVTIILAIIKRKISKNIQITHKIIKKIQFFALFSCNFIFLSCWGAAMDPLAGRMRPPGRVFEVPGVVPISL